MSAVSDACDKLALEMLKSGAWVHALSNLIVFHIFPSHVWELRFLEGSVPVFRLNHSEVVMPTETLTYVHGIRRCTVRLNETVFLGLLDGTVSPKVAVDYGLIQVDGDPTSLSKVAHQILRTAKKDVSEESA